MLLDLAETGSRPDRAMITSVIPTSGGWVRIVHDAEARVGVGNT